MRPAWVVMALVLTACGTGGAPVSTPSASPSTLPSPSASASASASPTASPTVSPSALPSAADALTGFFTAAARADARLRTAARLVNGDIGTTSARFDQRTVDAVRAAEPVAVAKAVPAGLPPALLTRVLQVYSDLAGRAAAFNRVGRTADPVLLKGPEGRDLLRCLGNGSALAARYPGDLAAARTLARALPPVTLAGPRSRAAAEVAIRLEALRLAHNGCDSCGGLVTVRQDLLTWMPRQDPGWGVSSRGWTTFGRYDEIPFRARYVRGAGWEVQLLAC